MAAGKGPGSAAFKIAFMLRGAPWMPTGAGCGQLTKFASSRNLYPCLNPDMHKADMSLKSIWSNPN
jgi:hypothetical protein